MIPVKRNVTEINNLPGEEVEFTISASAAHLIMQSIADLYSNRALAVIREYSTNAYDSHVEAGVDKPIDVTLPNELHPFFTVRDQGVGMSSKELKEVYTSFGDSTKRGSNDYNGLFGYGSKSALAYTNSFTITAVKNGRKSIGVVTRKDDGAMVLKEIVNAETIDGNGVTIEIPVSDVNEFNKIAMQFYEFWLPGRVEINGRPIKNPYIDDINRLDNNLYRIPDGDRSYVVMGNVPYPINNASSLFPTREAYQPFVAYVDNGAVEFTPSREALKYTDHTNKGLQSIVDSYIANVRALAEKEVKSAKTKWEALRFSRKWWDVLRIKIKYRGKEIPGEIPFDGYDWHVYRHWNPVETMRAARGDNIDLNGDFLVITEATATVSTYHRDRLRRWAKDHSPFGQNKLPNHVYFTQDAKWKNAWINPAHIVSWETVKAQTPPERVAAARTVGTPRVKGSFDVLRPDGTIAYGQPISNPVYWAPNHLIRRTANKNNLLKLINEFNITDDIVIVPANREAKFKRDFPNAIEIREHFRSQIDLDGNAMYNDDQRTYFSLSWGQRQRLAKMDPAKIADPDLKYLVEVSKMNLTEPAGYNKNLTRARLLGIGHEFKTFQSDSTKYDEIEARYPLLYRGFNYIEPHQYEHFYFYVDALVRARKNGEIV